jgi:hypothetical protein
LHVISEMSLQLMKASFVGDVISNTIVRVFLWALFDCNLEGYIS